MADKNWIAEDFKNPETFKLNKEGKAAIEWLAKRLNGNTLYTKRYLASLAFCLLKKEIENRGLEKHDRIKEALEI
jgi:hypothetical protein